MAYGDVVFLAADARSRLSHYSRAFTLLTARSFGVRRARPDRIQKAERQAETRTYIEQDVAFAFASTPLGIRLVRSDIVDLADLPPRDTRRPGIRFSMTLFFCGSRWRAAAIRIAGAFRRIRR